MAGSRGSAHNGTPTGDSELSPGALPPATSYGVQSEQVKTLSELTRAVKDALSSDRPHLIEISQRRLADS